MQKRIASRLVFHMERDTVCLADSYDFSVPFPATLRTRSSLCSSSRAKDTPFISGGEILVAARPIYRLLVFPREEGFTRISRVNVTSSFSTRRTLYLLRKGASSYLYGRRYARARKFYKKLQKPQKHCVNIRRCSTLERFVSFIVRSESHCV